MIDITTAQQVRRLAETQRPGCVSIYLPTHRSGAEAMQDPIRLKNQLSQAGAELDELGFRPAEVTERLAITTALLADHEFWQHLGQGLAVLATDERTDVHRLPHSVDELVVVADRLHVKPLLPAISSGEIFYVLALSQNHVRLLRGSRFGVDELALGDIPESLAAALWYDDREPALKSHAGTRIGRGTVTATFHGQGLGKDTHDADLDRFLLAVDGGVRHLLNDDGGHGVPLVLAGVDHVVARYRALSHLSTIVDAEIAGNPERLRPEELHDRAWLLVLPIFEAARERARDRFLAGAAPNVSTVSNAILPAHDGRVETLFVPVGVQRWGRFDPDRRLVEEHHEREPGDRDLLDVIAIETLIARGDVYAVDPAQVPGEGVLAGSLRY